MSLLSVANPANGTVLWRHAAVLSREVLGNWRLPPCGKASANQLLVRHVGWVDELRGCQLRLRGLSRHRHDLRASQVGIDLEVTRLSLDGDKLFAVFLPRGRPATKTLHGYRVLAGWNRELGVFT